MEFQETYFRSIPGISDNDITLVQLRWPTNMVRVSFFAVLHSVNKCQTYSVQRGSAFNTPSPPNNLNHLQFRGSLLLLNSQRPRLVCPRGSSGHALITRSLRKTQEINRKHGCCALLTAGKFLGRVLNVHAWRISLCTDLPMRKKLRVYPKFRF